MKTRKNTARITVELEIPMPKPDTRRNGGKALARALIRDMELTLGGVPVKARPV